MADVWFILYWLVLLLTLGVASMPIAWLLLKRLPDGGAGVTIPLTLVSIGWVVWLVASVHAIPFSSGSAWGALLLFFIVSWTIGWKKRSDFFGWMKSHRSILTFEFVLLAFSFISWSLVRTYQPDIEGLEKFMDGGFVQSILRSQWMPPADPWLSGNTINYYYFGHFIAGLTTMLSGLELSVAYNLLLATVFALSAVGAFSVVYNATGGRRSGALAGILTAVLLNLGGNLHTVWHLLFKPGVSYWYPDATRFIEFTIHEFPAYSHVVADLHGHLLNLPHVLLLFTILLAFLSGGMEKDRRNGLLFPAIFGFLLGIFSMTNTWDVPIYGLVIVGVSGLSFWGNGQKLKVWLLEMGSFVAVIGSVFVLTSILFQIHFTNIAKGVAFVQARSPFWQLGVLWGGFALISLVAVLHFFPKAKALLATPAGAPAGTPREGKVFLPLVMIGVSFLLIAIPEVVYVKDIYIQEYHRANTMFKLTYQSFVMFCLVFGIALGGLFENDQRDNNIKAFIKNSLHRVRDARQRRTRWTFVGIGVLLLVFVSHMFYPFYSIKGYYGLTTSRGLDGFQFLKSSYPDDYAAIMWMRQNIAGQPVVLEAVGESYTDFSRVSTFTGLPTVLGWRVHEWLWRGSFDEAGKRTDQVKEMYEHSDSELARSYYSMFKVRYIFVGVLERQTYKLDEEKLKSLGKIIFQSNDTYVVDRAV